jgi:predicted sugar kinase
MVDLGEGSFFRSGRFKLIASAGAFTGSAILASVSHFLFLKPVSAPPASVTQLSVPDQYDVLVKMVEENRKMIQENKMDIAVLKASVHKLETEPAAQITVAGQAAKEEIEKRMQDIREDQRELRQMIMDKSRR